MTNTSGNTPFKGFPGGKVRLTRIPAPFFSELLPLIDDLAELKITLYALWRLDREEGDFRYLRRADFSSDQAMMKGLGEKPQKALDEALQRAVTHGIFLEAHLTIENVPESYYFLNSPRGQAAVQAIHRGEWRPSGDKHTPVTLDMERPNIYRLYEENIGMLTPMIRDELIDAESNYPADWIEDAMHIAVENNVRRWRYVQAILRSWQEEGRDEQNRGNSEKNRRRYIEGPYGEFVEH